MYACVSCMIPVNSRGSRWLDCPVFLCFVLWACLTELDCHWEKCLGHIKGMFWSYSRVFLFLVQCSFFQDMTLDIPII
jgi:hypothetical protein